MTGPPLRLRLRDVSLTIRVEGCLEERVAPVAFAERGDLGSESRNNRGESPTEGPESGAARKCLIDGACYASCQRRWYGRRDPRRNANGCLVGTVAGNALVSLCGDFRSRRCWIFCHDRLDRTSQHSRPVPNFLRGPSPELDDYRSSNVFRNPPSCRFCWRAETACCNARRALGWHRGLEVACDGHRIPFVDHSRLLYTASLESTEIQRGSRDPPP